MTLATRQWASARVTAALLGFTVASAFLFTPSPAVSWITLAGIGSLAVGVTACLMTGALVIASLRPWIAALVPASIGLASVLWARDQASAITGWAAMASTLGLGLLVYLLAWLPGSRRVVLWGAVIPGALQAGMVLAGASPLVDGRAVALAGNPNLLGVQLGVVALVIALLSDWRWRYALAFAVTTIAAVGTASRKVAFVYVFLLLAMMADGSVRRAEWRRGLAVLLVLGLAMGALGLSGSLSGRWVRATASGTVQSQFVERVITTRELADQSSNERIAMVREGLVLWKKAPVVGNGLDQFRARSRFETYSHNNVIELLAGIGLVGALGFYAVHVGAMMLALMNRRSVQRWWVATCAILLAMSWDVALVSYREKAVWVLLGVAIGLAGGGWGRGDDGRAGWVDVAAR